MILFVLGVAIAYRLMTSLPLPSGIVQPVKKKKEK